jgi:hypothetical protein
MGRKSFASPPNEVEEFPPPVDQVARALCKRERRDHAVELLRAAVRRNPAGEPTAEALLRAIEARPDAKVAGPELELGFRLVDAYLEKGWFAEAKAVIDGADLRKSPELQERGKCVDLLTSVDEDAAPRLREAEMNAANGEGRLAIVMFDQWLATNGPLPDKMREKHDLLKLLLAPAQVDSSSTPTLPLVVRGCLDAIEKKGAKAAVDVARKHLSQQPSDGATASFLDALERVLKEPDHAAAKSDSSQTMAMNDSDRAEVQACMGHFGEALRLFREVAAEQRTPTPYIAGRVADLTVVTRFLAGGVLPMSLPPARLSVMPPVAPTAHYTAPTDDDSVFMFRIVTIG